jgi:DnaJ-domain-containing protein 1
MRLKAANFQSQKKIAKKQNQQKIKQENLNQKTKKENSEKEFYSRKGDKKNKISDVNIQKSIHLYKIFNLNYGCTIEELKDSYRKLLKKYHPDNFEGFPETQKMAERKTQELISAFNKLMELIG